jgi:glucose/mannose-6-phosphate isomerase
MLDDATILSQRDPEGALNVITNEEHQLAADLRVEHVDHDNRPIEQIVITGMGGSALAALVLKVWLKEDFTKPLDIVRNYDLPNYVSANTLVIASSYSGNTEETLSALEEAEVRGAQLAIIASGGKLIEEANARDIVSVQMPAGVQPRMALIYNLRGIVELLVTFNLVEASKLEDLSSLDQWLAGESANWAASVPTDQNYAKQLANQMVGKTMVFYGGPLTAPVAYKWKISLNETSKNMAFWNEYSEFNHNEFMGWTSHPIEKPFAVFDIISNLEHPQILKRFELSDQLLSGLRPKAIPIHLQGETLLAQLLWGCILADFVSFYVAVLNNVDPTPVVLIEKLKKEL